MGIAGAALATVIAQSLSVLWCLVLVLRRVPDLHLTRVDWRIGRRELGDATRLGLTMGFQMSIIAVGVAVLQYGVNQLGTDVVAAFTTAVRVEQVGVTPMISLGVALSTYVAQNHGAGEWHRIRAGVLRASLVSVGFALVLGLVMVLYGTGLVRLFVGDGADAVVAMAHQYLLITSSMYIVLALLFVLRNALQGLGVTAVPTIAGVMELLARAFVGLVLIGQVGFLGACLSGPLAWVGALVPLAVAWMVHRRRLIRIETAAAIQPVKIGVLVGP
jgi:Na+-driven multidrug efflux pump